MYSTQVPFTDKEYSKEVGFQEICYSKINVARIKEIRDIFAIRKQNLSFQLRLVQQTYFRKSLNLHLWK